MGSKNSERSRAFEFSRVGGSPGRCFLKTSTSACSGVFWTSFSSVIRMKGLGSFVSGSVKRARISSSEADASGSPVARSSCGRARSSVVTGSLRLRSMRTKTWPFLSISSSSHEPRDGIRLAVKTCLVGSFGSMM